ncbi:hypothetical protein GCM10010171_08520 [Actinokineospora fastidiosa]|uniref:Uncharacterized protein n=1 Tax=Actinokineospora fastidiosa TaxID=1816 RepID=A0A918G4W1_9PSEU|nr:hypothetical protein GCM10010171_08520 [Actinokineospora fastidiosa]
MAVETVYRFWVPPAKHTICTVGFEGTVVVVVVVVTRLVVVVVLVVVTGTSPCAASGSDEQPETAMDRKQPVVRIVRTDLSTGIPLARRWHESESSGLGARYA